MLFPLTFVVAGVLTPLLATTALSLGLLASAATLAQSRTPATKPVRRVDRPRSTPILNELARLHDELKLDVSQDTLWCKAEKADWCNMSRVQTGLRQQHEEILVLLAQTGADLRSVAKRIDDFQAEGQKLGTANRERWLNVYDALNASQKEQVRVFFKKKLEQQLAGQN